MSFIWIGNFFLSSSLIFLSPIFGKNFFLGILCVFIAVAVNTLALRSTKRLSSSKPMLVGGLILLCCAFFLPFPYSLPLFLLVISLFLIGFSFKSIILCALENSLFISGFILLLQLAFLPIYFKLSPRLFDFNLLAQPVSTLLNFFGAESFFQEGFLFVQFSKNVYPFANNSEKFGLYFLMNIFIGNILIISFYSKRSKLKAAIYSTFICIGYSIFRYCGLILAYGSYLTVDIFINPFITIFSFFPLAIIFQKTLNFSEKKDISVNSSFLNNDFTLHSLKSGIILISGVLLISFSFGFNDPGKIKKGRILINERHSNWEWSYLPFDKTTFGQKAVYNYSCLLTYLKYFYSVGINFDAIKPETLKDIDVLIIKMPTEALTPNEIKSVLDYVEKGGGLYLIGDHTNVFGTSGYLNQISEQFGIRFNYDATYNLTTGNLSVFEASRVLSHPIISGLPRFLFGTSCSLDCSFSAEDVIIGYQLRAVELDYSQKNFFPQKTNLPNLRYSLFLQSCGVKMGKGRVLAFSDSTVFSNFWFFMPGKSELLIKSIDWLNRENIFPDWTNSALFIFGILVFAIAAFKYFKHAHTFSNLIILVAAQTALIIGSILFFNLLNNRYYQYPTPHTDFQKVFFDLEHSNILLPLNSLVLSPDKGYETFFILTQRIGYVPRAIQLQRNAFKENSTLVIINPSENTRIGKNKDKKKDFTSFIENGGSVILMDNRCNENSISNYLLETFNIQINAVPPKSLGFKDRLGRSFSGTHCAATIEGGESALENSEKESLLSIVEKGKGRVIVISDSLLFSDQYLGTSMSVPNRDQKVIMDLAYWVFEELAIVDKKIKN